MNGFLLINKESGMTSRDVVNKVSKILGTKKIGHTGTLDPMATGVLVLCIGKYTKLVDYITSEKKEYVASIKLGIKTDTLDSTGTILNSEEPKSFDKESIINVLNSFVGKSIQTVPIYSAIHVNGKRLYEYARENIEVELPKREIEIFNIELISYENYFITFKVLVSKGTYIRSLINDICNKLGTYGCMNSLIRSKQGIFNIEDSYLLNDINNNKYKLLDIDDILDLEVIECDELLYKKVSNGAKMNNNNFKLYKYNKKNVALYYNGRLLIMY